MAANFWFCNLTTNTRNPETPQGGFAVVQAIVCALNEGNQLVFDGAEKQMNLNLKCICGGGAVGAGGIVAGHGIDCGAVCAKRRSPDRARVAQSHPNLAAANRSFRGCRYATRGGLSSNSEASQSLKYSFPESEQFFIELVCKTVKHWDDIASDNELKETVRGVRYSPRTLADITLKTLWR